MACVKVSSYIQWLHYIYLQVIHTIVISCIFSCQLTFIGQCVLCYYQTESTIVKKKPFAAIFIFVEILYCTAALRTCCIITSLIFLMFRYNRAICMFVCIKTTIVCLIRIIKDERYTVIVKVWRTERTMTNVLHRYWHNSDVVLKLKRTIKNIPFSKSC